MPAVSTGTWERSGRLVAARAPSRVDDRLWAVAAVAVLVAAGALLRIVLFRQSLFADELSTRWIIARASSPWQVVSIVHTDAEITPPLYFVLAWLFTRISMTPELLRMPSLLAGSALIPLVYAVGLRTVGRRAALVAAALTTFSPLMVYYSSEARGYELMVMLVVLSTYALLRASDDGGLRWWGLYGAASCAAMYTHYTAAFPLAGQLLWALWARPAARVPALAANVAAAVVFAPWYSGVRGDFGSATTQILSALQPFTPHFVRLSLEHSAVGDPYAFPNTRLPDVPGVPALVALGIAVVVAAAAVARRLWRAGPARPSPSPGLVLVVALALSVPVGEAVAGLLGTNLLGSRNLAASWPAFALVLSALVVAAGPRLGLVTAGLAVAAFAVGGVTMIHTDLQRPDVNSAVLFVERATTPRDVVVDGDNTAPAGVPGLLQASLGDRWRIFELGRDEVLYDPFRIVGRAPPATAVVARAARAARGGRVVFVLNRDATSPAALAGGDAVGRAIAGALPPPYHRLLGRHYPGLFDTWVLVYGRSG
jgi:hypothetical protein